MEKVKVRLKKTTLYQGTSNECDCVRVIGPDGYEYGIFAGSVGVFGMSTGVFHSNPDDYVLEHPTAGHHGTLKIYERGAEYQHSTY